MYILWKGTVSLEFLANRLKLYGNCVFPQNFHPRKLGKVAVLYAVDDAASLHLTTVKSDEYANPGKTFIYEGLLG